MVALIKENSVDLDRWFNAPPESVYVRPAAVWCDAVTARFMGEETIIGGVLPWTKLQDRFRIRPGEVTIWAGINGHGKSLITSQVMLRLAAQREKICIASLEMQPVATMHRMTRQAIGTGFPTERVIREFHDWTRDRLWLYEQQGTIGWERMVALGRYCAQELGITQLLIDSLMKCGIGVDDYNTQKRYVDMLCALAKDTNMHIHLVAHSRKGQHETDRIDKFSIKGASEITDQVDNVWTHWRNKRKETESEKSNPKAEILNEPDALLACVKQRHGEWEGNAALWFDKRSMQHLESPQEIPAYYGKWA